MMTEKSYAWPQKVVDLVWIYGIVHVFKLRTLTAMKTLASHLHHADTSRVSDYRATLCDVSPTGEFGKARYALTKHDSLEGVLAEIQSIVKTLRDSSQTIYGLVVQDLAPDDEDETSHRIASHRLRFSRSYAVEMAA